MTTEQRAALGIDRFFDAEDAAAIVGVTEQNIRDAVQRKSVSARYIPSQRKGEKKIAVKGLELIRWRDVLAGISDGPEDDYEKVE